MNIISRQDLRAYRNTSFIDRRFQHKLVKTEITKLDSSIFKINMIGKSLEERDVYSVVYGSGPTQIMFWSQMHGNEATATAALFDIFNFFAADDSFNTFRKSISEQFTLHFLPMINPDGAERFQRENALHVDLNRDAKKRSMPETHLLLDYHKSIKADIAFNLHDQRTHYNVAGTGKTATISFLAPAYNEAKEVNENREFAMKIIASMNKHLQKDIANHVARYNDSYGPRCVGDYFQSQGSATILIESGAYKDDYERQEVRELNVFAMINCLKDLHEDLIKQFKIEDYFDIPENDEKLFDILIRNAKIIKKEKAVHVDIGIRFKEFTDLKTRLFTRESFIEEIGDLSQNYGIKEFDALSYSCDFGKILDRDDVENEVELIKKGYTATLSSKRTFLRSIEHLAFQFNLESSMDFIFKKENEAVIAIINDKIIDLRNETFL